MHLRFPAYEAGDLTTCLPRNIFARLSELSPIKHVLTPIVLGYFSAATTGPSFPTLSRIEENSLDSTALQPVDNLPE